MPKIMSLGNCTCEDWVGHAQDLSDRIVNSSMDFPLGGVPMFDFCPYCGKKLVVAGAGHKNVGTWNGKSLLEYDHEGLINIINKIDEAVSDASDCLRDAIDALSKSGGS